MKFIRALALCLACLLLLGAVPLPANVAKADNALPYWIGVDLVNQRVTIYRTQDNSVIHRWKCSTGRSSTPTPAGKFIIPAGRNTNRKEWYHFGNCYVKYAVRITGAIYFHSILFSQRSDDTLQVESLNLLGQAASHGCVRLEVPHAKWISDNVPIGTLVVIHRGVSDTRITNILGQPAGTDTTPSLPMPPTVQALNVTPAGPLVLNRGEQVQLSCEVVPAEATTKLTWKSSKSKFVTVDENGLVTAVGNGKATITVKASNGVSASVAVESVDSNVPTGVSLDQKGTVTVNLGEALQLNAALSPSTAVSALTWTSSKPSVAVVDENGLVVPVAKGTAKITVKTYNNKKATVKVKVLNPFEPTAVALQEGPILTVPVGASLTLTPVLSPANAITTLSWKTSKKKVVAVAPDGTITALKKGKAKITVTTANRKKAVITVVVTQ